MDPLSAITFQAAEPAPVMRAAPGARVTRDGGRNGRDGESDAPPRERNPDADGDDAAPARPAAPDGDAVHHLDLIADDTAEAQADDHDRAPRIDLTA